MVLGNVMIYALGVPWLMLSLDTSLANALALGVVPFLIGDAVKLAFAAGMLPGAWRLVGEPDR
ncbi:MAG: biotin transporter BioY, partial [Acidimicrobiia bacterium]